MARKHVVIIGGGFAGLNCAKELGNKKNVDVTLIDRRNHHLFQPLLYQVAMAGLSPADIAVPIRGILHRYRNIKVLQGIAESVHPDRRQVQTDFGTVDYDYLLMATGAKHNYFGNEQWEIHAPGLKTLSQATEIRTRVLSAFEKAETCQDPELRRKYMTFVVVGGGPTGVELAGALGEMSRYTLARDFRNIDPSHTRVILIEAGPRVLTAFNPRQSAQAARDLERLGVTIWTETRVSRIDGEGVEAGHEKLMAGTVLWAAGVQASRLGVRAGWDTDRACRVKVGADLSLPDHPEVFVAGDAACVAGDDGKPLPGLAPVAQQQGRYLARLILGEIRGKKERPPFRYFDKGHMATIGRSRAVMEMGRLRLKGLPAWVAWMFVHVFFLTGFRNRFFVVFQWAWSYLYFRRGARLIVKKEWQFWGDRSAEG